MDNKTILGISENFQRYKCHKEIAASRISNMQNNQDGSALLSLDNVDLLVDADWNKRHSPMVGGYFVVYSDGYASYSPAKSFENGYSKV